MSGLPGDYLERVYAGVLGKAIGVRLGAPLEDGAWTYDRIRDTFGEVNGYVRDYTNFAADDDTNGFIFFVRALTDRAADTSGHTAAAGAGPELSAEDIGRAWLNYTAEGHGMFWWGGYGISTEHTAYSNLKNGIRPPLSGSIAQNGQTLAEQIGGQIFIEPWGLVCPGNPGLAAHYARMAASVSHDGNGVYGGVFIAACVSRAFVADDVGDIVNAGLSVIPADCEYARMARDVIEFHGRHPRDFRDCYGFVRERYGYDRYPGVCHIIPNSAVVVLSLLYGEGSFARTIGIAATCGWDTDCNAGNAGCIVGVAGGLGGISGYWRGPVNDVLIASSVVGSLNVVDIPTLAADLASLGRMIAEPEQGLPLEANRSRPVPGRQPVIRFGFELPGSTHGFRLSDSERGCLENSSGLAFAGTRSLRVSIRALNAGQFLNLFYKPFYRRSDFDDERYQPCFSPLVYPGQVVSLRAYLAERSSGRSGFRLYARNARSREFVTGEGTVLDERRWAHLTFLIPDMNGGAIDEVGLRVECLEGEFSGVLFVDEFIVAGKSDYAVDFRNEAPEFGSVTQFTYNGGYWTIEDGEMSGISSGLAEAFTGDIGMREYVVEAVLVPKCGASHNVNFRVNGAMRSYAVGFDGPGRITLFKNENGYRELSTARFDWSIDRAYRFRVEAIQGSFVVRVDGDRVLVYTDDDAPYLGGAVGFSHLSAGHTHFRSVRVLEL